MNQINIPKGDLHGSTDYFGSTVSRDVCLELMDHYLEAGGKYPGKDLRWSGELRSVRATPPPIRMRLSVGQIVIGYLINQAFPAFALRGPKTLGDPRVSIDCADTRLLDETIDYLECGARI